MLDLGALETLDRALAAPSRGALPRVACGDSPRDISGQKMEKARAAICPFSGRSAA
jgi:hypothetical protein